MVDKEELETVEIITTIILNISLITATVITAIKELCNIFKPGRHSKK